MDWSEMREYVGWARKGFRFGRGRLIVCANFVQKQIRFDDGVEEPRPSRAMRGMGQRSTGGVPARDFCASLARFEASTARAVAQARATRFPVRRLIGN